MDSFAGPEEKPNSEEEDSESDAESEPESESESDWEAEEAEEADPNSDSDSNSESSPSPSLLLTVSFDLKPLGLLFAGVSFVKAFSEVLLLLLTASAMAFELFFSLSLTIFASELIAMVLSIAGVGRIWKCCNCTEVRCCA